MLRRIFVAFLCLYILFIIYNSLTPFTFNFDLSLVGERLSQMNWDIRFWNYHEVSMSDVVGSIIFYIPFGFFIFILLPYENLAVKLLVTVIYGVLLSSIMEFMQIFVAVRDASPDDFYLDCLGTAIGAVLGGVYSGQVLSIVRKSFYELLNDKPFLLVLFFMAAAHFVAVMIPFKVSISFSDLVSNIKEFNVKPFGYQSFSSYYLDRPTPNDFRPYDITLVIEQVLYWIAAGYVLMLSYRVYWREQYSGILLLAGLPLFYFPALEACQLMVVSHTTDINHILAGYLGILIGWILYFPLRPLHWKSFKTDLDYLKVPLIIYGLYMVFAALRPFDWSFSEELLRQNLSRHSLFPFLYSSFYIPRLSNYFELVPTLFYFLPISLYWTFRLREKHLGYGSIYLLTVMTGIVVGMSLEMTQVFSATRVGSATDVLAYGLGGAIGTFLIYYYEKRTLPNLDFIRKGQLTFR